MPRQNSEQQTNPTRGLAAAGDDPEVSAGVGTSRVIHFLKGKSLRAVIAQKEQPYSFNFGTKKSKCLQQSCAVVLTDKSRIGSEQGNLRALRQTRLPQPAGVRPGFKPMKAE